MKYPIALFCSLCMLLLWAACDSQGGRNDSCSPSPSPGEASFMPVQVGDSWTYVYENHNRFERDVMQDSGQVHLTAIAAECSQGQRLVTLQQEVQLERWSRWTIWGEGGTKDTTAVSQIEEVQQVQLVEYEDGRVLHPFATQPFMRFHPATHDTVEVEGGQVGVHDDYCSVEGLMSLYLTKKQGIVSASFSDCFGSVATSASGYLELIVSQKSSVRSNR